MEERKELYISIVPAENGYMLQYSNGCSNNLRSVYFNDETLKNKVNSIVDDYFKE